MQLLAPRPSTSVRATRGKMNIIKKAVEIEFSTASTNHNVYIYKELTVIKPITTSTNKTPKIPMMIFFIFF
jgi:hypothetical protein